MESEGVSPPASNNVKPYNNHQVPGFSITLGELVEGLLGPKQRPGSLPLHFALKPTPSGSKKEGEEA